MIHLPRLALPACLVAIIAASVCESVSAAVVYGTHTKYLTGQDPYTNPELGATDEAFGTSSTSLDHAGPGPLGGNFSFSGAADAAALALKTRAAVTLASYPLGSFYNVNAPTYDYLPISGSAYSMARDQVLISGADATYNVEFVYQLTGTAARGAGNYEYYFRPTVSTSVALQTAASGTDVGFDGTAFYPSGTTSSTVTLTIQNVPSNTPLNLTQVMQVLLYSADSEYLTDIDPFQTDDWDPAHIIHQTSLIGEDPYSVSYSADFSHTLALQDVILRHQDGGIAAGALLTSQNGIQYPGQVVPEPATLGLLCAGLGILLATRRRPGRCAVHPAGRSDGRTLRFVVGDGCG